VAEQWPIRIERRLAAILAADVAGCGTHAALVFREELRGALLALGPPN
jgi:hypothetical protein